MSKNLSISEYGKTGLFVSKDGRVFKEVKQWSDSDGYQYVTFLKKNYPVHRLVASCYVDGNTSETPVVCHKDDNPKNNIFGNLEWGTYSKNNYDAYKRNLKTRNIVIRCIETGEVFHSAREAARAKFGIPKRGDHILQVIRGERAFAYGYHWEVVPR